MNNILDLENYYRKDIYRHFTEDCKCSTSITYKIDVTELKDFSKKTNTKFYVNFLYLLCKTLNQIGDFKMNYDFRKNEVIRYDVIHPTQYIFHEDTETFTLVYTNYSEDYKEFYEVCIKDIEKGKQTREYGLDSNHPNWFDASYIPWISYESLNVELLDGYLYYLPIVNWGKYEEINGRYKMPVTIRMNHAIADGYHISKAFLLLEKELKEFTEECKEEKI